MDYLKFDYGFLKSANKSKDYQERLENESTILMKFLKDNSLILIEPFNENGEVKKDLKVRQSNLTEEGKILFQKDIPGWFKYLDRGGKAENISRLEKGLKKIREENEIK
jgi:hypothetical protein